ncbi:hypothetical protein NO995_01335 [Aestuariibaculum sp. M13]|uniref:methyltransferase n=1 Tax=Aestuariibaculum sp. M13 TaxID=2967132 RepID=UPI002159D21D|nr:methyltransferase [Aestuariibaculum sp. M13]MCR8666312.1 hypothetical protein [Aestuariibaculum sp. M13]
MKILKHQFWHLVFLTLSLVSVYWYIGKTPEVLDGAFLNLPTAVWLAIAIISSIAHQIYVLICWRLELHRQSISKSFGPKGFKFYKLGFAILILSRVVTIIILAFSNNHTFNINTILHYTLIAVCLIPSAYLFYSVKKYFGMDRAFGIDHFQPDTYKDKPFIKRGIFKYTSNGMYIYGFLALYLPGFLLQSKAAILVAVFNHTYIWVHYYFTELPDIKYIYRNN